MFLAGIDLTVLHIATPRLTVALRPSNVSLLWILDAYSLTVAALLVTFGTLGDKFGRKKVVLSGFIVFGAASLACAFSTSATQLVPARVALGVGTAMIMASTVSIIRVVFTDDKERMFAIGLWTAAHSIGASLGPLIGGFLVEHYWWGSVFLVNVPIVVAVAVAGFIVIPESKNPAPPRWDALSAAMSVVALGSIVYSIKVTGTELAFVLPAILIGIAGLAVAGLFVHRQLRLREPLLDLHLFADRRFSVATACVLVCFGNYTAMLYFFAQWFQYVGGYTSLVAGAALSPMALANAVGAALAARTAETIGLRWSIAAGLSIFATGLILISAAGDLSNYWWTICPMLVLIGGGAGIIMTLGADAIMSAAQPERSGEAAAIQETSFELGAGLGIALLGTLLASAYQILFTTPAGAASVSQSGMPPSLSDAFHTQLSPAMVDTARTAYNGAIHVVCYSAAASLLSAAVLSCLLLRFSESQSPSDAVVQG
ncbi:MFS transporter [Mycolicibacterium sp. CBM1]